MRTNNNKEENHIDEQLINKDINPILRLFKYVHRFSVRISEDKIGVFSAQASFFMLLSIFPMIMLMLNIIGHTSLPDTLIPAIIKGYTPSTIRSFLLQTINELQKNSSGTAISISAIIAIWAASKGALAIISGMRVILDATKDINYFLLRIYSMIYTILIIIGMVLALVLLVFGNRIFDHFIDIYPVLTTLEPVFSLLRYVVVMLILTLFFISMYKMGGNKRYKFGDLLPGAMFSALCWMIFSYIFSIYVDNFSNFSYMYGSLTAVIIVMIWIYFCMYIMFIGAEIIEYIFDHK